MKMLSKIALVISILACAGALYLANQLGNQRNGLRVERDNTQATLRTTEGTLKKTQTDLTAKTEEQKNTQLQLETTQGELSVEKQKVEDLTGQLATKKTELETTTAKLDEITKNFNLVKKDLEVANQKLDVSRPEDFAKLRDEVDALTKKKGNLEGELGILTQTLKSKETEIAKLNGEIDALKKVPENLRGSVVLVQPEWGFLVMDVGHDQRVQTNAEFIVYRNDQLVTKVKVVEVQKSVSLAEFVKGFQQMPPQVGDTVVY
jgi:septal ring factor EnvC (AmiA/AmiB activator)